MFKLVVISCVLALAAAKPNPGVVSAYGNYGYPLAHGYAAPAAIATSYAAAPALSYAAAPAVAAPAVSYAAAPALTTYAAAAPAIAAPAVATYAAPAPAVATYAAAPAVAAVKYAAPAVAVAPAAVAIKPAMSYTAPQQIGTEIQKTVQIADVPTVTGYSQSIVKPDLGLVATPGFQYAQFPTLAAGRKVQTIIPQETRVEPEVHIQRMPYDVPVPRPYVGAVEVRTPVVQGPTPVVHEKVAVPGAPIVAPAKVAVHDVPTPVAAAPVAYSSYAPAAPAVAYSGYAPAAPAVAYSGYAPAAPAVAYSGYPAAVPAVAAKIAAVPAAYTAGAYAPAAYAGAYAAPGAYAPALYHK